MKNKINSKAKGKRGENELARVLREYGFEARRTQQYCGNTGAAADIVGLPYIHIECKRVEKLNIDEALEQAKRDSEPTINDIHKPLKLPAVFHRMYGGKTKWLKRWLLNG